MRIDDEPRRACVSAPRRPNRHRWASGLVVAACGLAACTEDPLPEPLGTHAFDLPAQVELDDEAVDGFRRLCTEDEVWIVAEKIPRRKWQRVDGDAEGVWRGATRFPPAGRARVGPSRAMIPVGGGADGEGVHPDQLMPGSILVMPEGIWARVDGDEPEIGPFSYPTRGESVRDEYWTLDADGQLAPVEMQLVRHTRQAVSLPMPWRVSYELELPERAAISTAFAVRNLGIKARERALQVVPVPADVVTFRIEVTDVTRRTEVVFEKAVETRPPTEVRAGFLEAHADLSKWGGDRVTISLVAEPTHRTANEDGALSFAILAEPVLGSGVDQGIPNVVVFLLDTLRADRLGCYGWTRAQTDRIDRFALRGVRYADAMSAAPWTLPSHASLFSSNYLSEHMLWTERRLGDEHTTIAEVLKERGYATAAITEGGFVRSAYGLAQGFDLFEAEPREADETFASAREWIDSTRGPYFAFIQTYQVHSPYDPPDEFRHIVRPYEGEMKPSVHVPDYDWGHPRKRASLPEPADRAYVEDLYDAEIAYVDDLVGAFLDYLEDRGDLDETLVVITSDHGDEFFDHGQAGHGWSLYQEQLHVPLILYMEGVFEGGEVVEHPVHLVDLAPTIARLCGARIPEEWSGVPLGFAPPTTERPLFAPFWTRFHKERGKPAVALREGRYKFIDYPPGHRPLDRFQGPALFDLEADPREERNLLTEENRSEWEAKVRRAYELYPERGAASEVDRRRVDTAELEALGYVGDEDEADATEGPTNADE